MRVIYRMRGLLGDATEEFVETMDSRAGQNIHGQRWFPDGFYVVKALAILDVSLHVQFTVSISVCVRARVCISVCVSCAFWCLRLCVTVVYVASADDGADDEEQYRMASVLCECGGLDAMLTRYEWWSWWSLSW